MLNHMAIRFQCPSCEQPIEIDDEWAEKPVACPFCRKTVTAPVGSTLHIQTVPVASPIASPSSFDAGLAVAPADVPTERRHALPIWALVLSVSAIVLNFAPLILFPEDVKQWDSPDASERVMEQMQKGQIPPGMLRLAALGFLDFLAWVSGGICGLISLRYRAQRRITFTSLALSLAFLLMMCAGVFVKFGG